METIQVEVRHRLDRDCGGSENDELRELVVVEAKIIRELILTLHRKVDILMTDLTALQAAVDGLVTAEVAGAEELVALKDEISTLVAGEVTQEQIDSITSKVQATAEALATATETAEAPEGGEPPAEPPVEEGGEPPAGEAPSEGGAAE